MEQKNDFDDRILMIGKTLKKFISSIDSIYEGFELNYRMIKRVNTKLQKELNDLVTQVGKIEEKTEDGKVLKIAIPQEKRTQVRRNIDVCNRYMKMSELVPISLFVSLVSQYDTFIGEIIRAIYFICPDKLNSSNKTISYTELAKYNNIEEVKNDIIESIVETVLRDSHDDQFDWLEKNIECQLKKLDCWGLFVELTQRRNLFVHCDGKVSAQYIKKCKNVNIANIANTGEKLMVDSKYFSQSYEILYEIAVKLCFVLVRKMLDKELKAINQFDGIINDFIYNLICSKRYNLAINISDFVTDKDKKSYSGDAKCVYQVNRAQAYKWNGNDERCKEILEETINLNTFNDEYRMIYFVLTDQYEEAYDTMLKIGDKSQIININNYRDWPIFQKIRKEEKFENNFQTIFSEPLIDNSMIDFTEMSNELWKEFNFE